jgi:hypothetical protein
MTQRDRDRLVVLKKAQKYLIAQKQAAQELGLSDLQVRLSRSARTQLQSQAERRPPLESDVDPQPGSLSRLRAHARQRVPGQKTQAQDRVRNAAPAHDRGRVVASTHTGRWAKSTIWIPA